MPQNFLRQLTICGTVDKRPVCYPGKADSENGRLFSIDPSGKNRICMREGEKRGSIQGSEAGFLCVTKPEELPSSDSGSYGGLGTVNYDPFLSFKRAYDILL